MSVAVGQVYYESWGYDQTNIDFCQIVSVSPTGKTVICKMMSKRQIDDSHMAPGEAFGVSFRLHVRRNNDNGEVRLVGQYPFVQGQGVWNNRNAEGYGYDTRSGYFFPYEGKPKYETPFGMGH